MTTAVTLPGYVAVALVSGRGELVRVEAHRTEDEEQRNLLLLIAELIDQTAELERMRAAVVETVQRTIATLEEFSEQAIIALETEPDSPQRDTVIAEMWKQLRGAGRLLARAKQTLETREVT